MPPWEARPMLTSADMSRLEEIFAVAELQVLELWLWRLWNCLYRILDGFGFWGSWGWTKVYLRLLCWPFLYIRVGTWAKVVETTPDVFQGHNFGIWHPSHRFTMIYIPKSPKSPYLAALPNVMILYQLPPQVIRGGWQILIVSASAAACRLTTQSRQRFRLTNSFVSKPWQTMVKSGKPCCFALHCLGSSWIFSWISILDMGDWMWLAIKMWETLAARCRSERCGMVDERHWSPLWDDFVAWQGCSFLDLLLLSAGGAVAGTAGLGMTTWASQGYYDYYEHWIGNLCKYKCTHNIKYIYIYACVCACNASSWYDLFLAHLLFSMLLLLISHPDRLPPWQWNKCP